MTDLEQPLAQFRADLVRQGRLVQTAAAYARDVRQFGRWCDRQAAGPARLTDLTAAYGRAYCADLQRKGLAPSSINRHLAGLRVFLAWAVTAGHLPANPLARMPGLPAPAPQPIWLDTEQQARLEAGLAQAVLATPGLAPTLRDQTMILLLCHTGIRVGELVGLTLADVTLTEGGGSLRVQRAAGQPERRLALNAVVRRALAAYLARRSGDRGAWLFIGQRGAVGPRQVQRILRKWAQVTGLPPALVTVHTLRHTFGYNLVRAGLPLDQAAALLGYTSLNPLRHYLTAPAPDLQQVVESVLATHLNSGA